MIIKTGDMFELSTGWVLATGNSCVRFNTSIVMGAGAAKELQNRHPETPVIFGDMLARAKIPYGEDNMYQGRRYPRYGLMLYPEKKCGLFQTKYHWRRPSPVSLVEYSINMLTELAVQNPDTIFNVNYPGVGHGGLGRAEVAPLIETMPDNVYVWKFR